MKSIFYDYSDRAPAWVRVVFGGARILCLVIWFFHQLWKTLIWMPLAMGELLQGDLGPDAVRILLVSLGLLLFAELYLGLFLFTVVEMRDPLAAIVIGAVVYGLIGIMARASARPYNMLN